MGAARTRFISYHETTTTQAQERFTGCTESTRLKGAASQAALFHPRLLSLPLDRESKVGPSGRKAKTLFPTGGVVQGFPPHVHACR